MAVLLAIWFLVLTCVRPRATNPVSSSTTFGSIASNSAESSGALDTDSSTTTDVSFTSTEISTVISSTNSIFSSEAPATTSPPILIGAAIIKFIQQHLSLIIIGGILLILLIVIVCTVVLVKQNYKASAYYPSSYPKKKYVDEQDKGGSAKTFDEIPEKVNDETKEDGGSSSKQLEADILNASHNLKKKTPPKGEADVAEKGECSQSPDKEGGSVTAPGAKESEGQTSGTVENKADKAPETDGKEDGSDKLPTEKEQKGEGDGKQNKENDEEEGKSKGTKKKSESGEDPNTNSNQQPANDVGSKSPIADAAETKGSSEGQKPKGLNEASNVAEASVDLSDLEKIPLIPNPNGVPGDGKAI
ncbi:uncharacterized protein LOC144502905 [Mustelus asterias]